MSEDSGATWELNEMGEPEVTDTCDNCGETHTVRLIDPAEQAVILQIRQDGKTRLLATVPPHMAVAAVMRALEEFAGRNGMTVRDALKRARVEAEFGPLGMPSEN